MRTARSLVWLFCAALLCGGLTLASAEAAVKKAAKRASTTPPAAQAVAAELDKLILHELAQAKVTVAPLANDEDFVRRISFDIAGQPPSPQDVTLFGLNPDGDKRAKLIDHLLDTPEYGRNWAGYWRDAIFLNATNMRARAGQSTAEAWLAEQLNQNHKWDQIVTDLLTATGDVQENGATALFFAHQADPAEVASEACRLFLGIQIQCANCHDHPSDVWKREQFHELAAYFPRTALRPVQQDGVQRSFEVVSVNQAMRRGGGEPFREDPERFVAMLDRNRDKKISKEEAQGGPMGGGFARIFDRILENGDTDKDGAISIAELRKLPPPDMQPGRGSAEYYMADLKDPSSKGTVINPKFFVDQSSPGKEQSDMERRYAAAKSFTNPENPWFARALINRVWNEMLGEGFYMPVDDLGPTRTPRYPQALDTLSAGFVANGYDVKWLVRTVANTQAYQRQVRSKPVSEGALPFASQTPTRLRSDQLFNALTKVLGFEDRTPAAGAGMMGGMYAMSRSPRSQFNAVFTFDPSTPQEDLTGNVQQSLLMMNSPAFRGAISGMGNTRLAQILRTQKDDQDALSEVYLLALAREPSDREVKLAQQYVRDVDNRTEAFEDLLWSLLNSSEFLSKR
jgi:hypothetical protein